MILEAMKMEHTIVSPRDGVIERVAFAENQLVPADAVLFAFREGVEDSRRGSSRWSRTA